MTTMFRVPFHSQMSDADAARLRAELGMTTHLRPKHPAVDPPLGHVPLDLDSGLVLVRGERDDEWAIEGRTWGRPGPGSVSRWRDHAVYAARQLDPGAAPQDSERPA